MGDGDTQLRTSITAALARMGREAGGLDLDLETELALGIVGYEDEEDGPVGPDDHCIRIFPIMDDIECPDVVAGAVVKTSPESPALLGVAMAFVDKVAYAYWITDAIRSHSVVLPGSSSAVNEITLKLNWRTKVRALELVGTVDDSGRAVWFFTNMVPDEIARDWQVGRRAALLSLDRVTPSGCDGVPTFAAAPVDQPAVCPACRNPVSPNAKFCGSSGSPLAG